MTNSDGIIFNLDGSLRIRRRPVSDKPRYRINQCRRGSGGDLLIKTDPIEKVLAEAIGVLDDVLAEASAGLDELLAEAADGIDELLEEATIGIDEVALGTDEDQDDWPTEADLRELGEITKFLDAGGSYAKK